MTQENPNNIPGFAPLDPPDWTTEDIASHLHKDVAALKLTLENAIRTNDTDKLLDDIQNFHGRVRSWLRLYSMVTKQEIEPINM
ncbi:MAG: hypothetical protein IKE69_11515 [Thermoguttaceae bacterium]|nr:hypothetical protein [Thermoguttaceae bacterium]